MIRIYGKFEQLEFEYDDYALIKISTEPFTDEDFVRYLDIEEGESYRCFRSDGDEDFGDWKIYNGVECQGEFLYNPETTDFIDSEVIGWCHGKDSYAKLADGRTIYLDKDKNYDGYELGWYKYQEYKDGEPVGEPYFEEVE